MHPAIADIVSACFYDGQLRTNAAKAQEYRKGEAPLRSSDPGLIPDTPIIFVDMPFCREQYGYKGGDRGPAWSNPDEVKAVVKALEFLRAVPACAPTLAVLSPYREQVNLLKRTIEGARPAAP
jgi:hypothetical protein